MAAEVMLVSVTEVVVQLSSGGRGEVEVEMEGAAAEIGGESQRRQC